MSADNWAVCPRCIAQARAAEAAQLAEVMARYGQVSVEVFDAERAAIQPVNPRDYATFREDYEIYGADTGIVKVSYGGSCVKCGLSLTFEEQHPIPGLNGDVA